jgi:uncharacterized membrane protein YoaK (UPF0700 family)
MLLLSSNAIIHSLCNTIIPTTTILSSSILSRQKTSSIFHSTDKFASEVTDFSYLSQIGGADDLAIAEAAGDIIDIDKAIDQDERNEDKGRIGPQLLPEENDENTPLVSIVPSMTTSLVVNGILPILPDIKPINDKLVLNSPKQPMTGHPSSTIFVCALAMISGFGEICSLKSYGCFVNMVTGSTVRIILGIVEGQFDMIRIPLCVTTGYLSGIMLARIFKKNIEVKRVTPANQLQNNYEILHQRLLPTRISQMYFTYKNLLQLTKSIFRKRYTSSLSSELLWSVTPLIFFLFTFPEVFNAITRTFWGKNIVTFFPLSLNVLLQAIGYGLIAQIVSDILTIPTNVYVLTGHYVTITKSIIDIYINRLYSNSATNSTSSLKPRQRSILSFAHNPQQLQSIQILLSFVTGALVALAMYQCCTFLLPIQHSITGFLFITTFLWYSLRRNDNTI